MVKRLFILPDVPTASPVAPPGLEPMAPRVPSSLRYACPWARYASPRAARSINGIRFLLLLALATALSQSFYGARSMGATGGMVIYKQFSFDRDADAEIANYTTFDHYAFVDNVRTPSGQTLRILSGQDPVYIPEPGNPGSTSEDATRTIQAAEKRFPQFAAKLENVRHAWEAMPKATPTPAPAPASVAVPQPTPPGKPTNVLRTKSGHVFYGWSISAFEGKTVVIHHSGGVSRIPASDLPNDLIGSTSEKASGAEASRTSPGSNADRTTSGAPPRSDPLRTDAH